MTSRHFTQFVVLCAALGLAGCSGKRSSPDSDSQKQAVEKQLSDADNKWDAGEKADAVDLYESLLSGREGKMVLNRYMDGELPRIFRRVIDYKIGNGGLEAARDDIERALQWNVTLSLSSLEANDFVAQIREERKTENREAENRLADSNQGDSDGGTTTTGKSFSKDEIWELFKTLTLQIKVGMSQNQVIELLGEPTEKEDQYKKTGLDALKGLEIWRWRNQDSDDGSIILGIKDGRLQSGGTPGYDIETGFKLRSK